MKKLFFMVVAFLYLSLFVIAISEAGCLQCALGVLVCEGDTKFDAISRCGNPDYSEETSIETEGSVRGGRVSLSEQKVEKLYYNCGEKRFSKILTIKNGKIISIKDGDWGSGPVRCQ